jgi:hypothetical protein
VSPAQAQQQAQHAPVQAQQSVRVTIVADCDALEHAVPTSAKMHLLIGGTPEAVTEAVQSVAGAILRATTAAVATSIRSHTSAASLDLSLTVIARHTDERTAHDDDIDRRRHDEEQSKLRISFARRVLAQRAAAIDAPSTSGIHVFSSSEQFNRSVDSALAAGAAVEWAPPTPPTLPAPSASAIVALVRTALSTAAPAPVTTLHPLASHLAARAAQELRVGASVAVAEEGAPAPLPCRFAHAHVVSSPFSQTLALPVVVNSLSVAQSIPKNLIASKLDPNWTSILGRPISGGGWSNLGSKLDVQIGRPNWIQIGSKNGRRKTVTFSPFLFPLPFWIRFWTSNLDPILDPILDPHLDCRRRCSNLRPDLVFFFYLGVWLLVVVFLLCCVCVV